MLNSGINEKKIIQAIADGLFVGYAIFDPKVRNSHFYDIIGNNKRPKVAIRRTLKRLLEKDMISLGGEQILLTKKGKRLLEEANFEDVIHPLDTWDGRWNLLSYDIPTRQKKVCDYFRRKLIEVGYTQVHKSLWVYPYNYKEEIAVFAHSLDIAPYIMYMQTDSIPNEKHYLEYYSLHR
jgi:DNA-binding transcriptional regulator PaaX